MHTHDNQPIKLKKNAKEFVDKQAEFKNDPKYKTEMCKTWVNQNFCPYGNKCRFAHGRKDLFRKNVDAGKYKQKECSSFYFFGFCLYGERCHFKHDERRIETLYRNSYYSYLLNSLATQQESIRINRSRPNRATKRLSVFAQITGGDNDSQKPSCYSHLNPKDYIYNETRFVQPMMTIVL